MVRKKRFVNFWGSFILGWFDQLQDSELNGTDYRTMFYLCEEMNHENNVTYLKQKQIAEHLRTNKGNVSRSITKLKRKQFITKSENGFMINPHLFYVGKNAATLRFRLRDTFDELVYEREGFVRFYMNEDIYELEEKVQTNGDSKE